MVPQSRSRLLQRPGLLFCFYKIVSSRKDPAGFQPCLTKSHKSILNAFVPFCVLKLSFLHCTRLKNYGKQWPARKNGQRYTSKAQMSQTQTCREIIFPGKIQYSVCQRLTLGIFLLFICSKWSYDPDLYHNGLQTQNCINKLVLLLTEPSFSEGPRDAWQCDCCAGQISTSHPIGLGMCVPKLPPTRNQDVNLWGCSKNTIFHISALLCWAATPLCNMVI